MEFTEEMVNRAFVAMRDLGIRLGDPISHLDMRAILRAAVAPSKTGQCKMAGKCVCSDKGKLCCFAWITE